ncbi:hypothetical protein ACSBR1_039583 [Camellia fascicularis]
MVLGFINSARFLWKSIPSSVKESRLKMVAVWKIGQLLWMRDYAGVHEAIRGFNWSQETRDFSGEFVSTPIFAYIVMFLLKKYTIGKHCLNIFLMFLLKNPDAEVIALSPKTLMATNRFICEVCNKGFQRVQNLQLHRRGQNLPWKLKQKNTKEVVKRKVYLCPEPPCVHHDPSRALGDLISIKKHYFRKHGEKKYKCEKCSKKYAVQSDWKAHSKTCDTREYRCDCGTLFSRSTAFFKMFNLQTRSGLSSLFPKARLEWRYDIMRLKSIMQLAEAAKAQFSRDYNDHLALVQAYEG